MSAPDKVHAEQFVEESEQRVHLGSQDEQTIPFSNQYPSGHGEWQVELRRKAVSDPDGVQDEQSVEEEEHIWHFGSHEEQTVLF